MRARVLHKLRFERVRNATECVRRRLSPEAGSTFSLFIEGRDPAQIAASLDLSQATVSRYLRSIRDMLRHELDQDR
ncbi:MAG: ArsR family transcriptional regulator, partial [Phycisphaerales bacterium]